MENKKLIRSLNRLGFPLMEHDEEIDVNSVIYEIIKSKEARLLAGFPVLLANAARHPGFNYKSILRYCRDKKERERLISFMILSLALYRYFHLKFWWAKKISAGFTPDKKKLINKFVSYLRKNVDFKIMKYKFNAGYVKNTFENYFQTGQSDAGPMGPNYEELSLEFALSQVFSPKQKSLFLKKLKGEKMTKTDREYYSRTVKKKVIALADPELHSLARKLLS